MLTMLRSELTDHLDLVQAASVIVGQPQGKT